MKFLFSKHLYASVIALVLITPLTWASISSIQVGNAAPVFMNTEGKPTQPSDGGLANAKPAHLGETITFSATAIDINGDDYYLAICKTDRITPVEDGPPVCNDGGFGVSPLAKSGEKAELAYQIDDQAGFENQWFAFVCDHASSGAACSKPKNGEGPTGSPFLAYKQVGVLRFGDNCPDLTELESLKRSETGEISTAYALKNLQKDFSRRQVRNLIRQEIEGQQDERVREELKILDNEIASLKDQVREGKALTRAEENEIIESFFQKKEKLKGILNKNVRFCITTSNDDRLENVVDKKDKVIEKKEVHQIAKEGLTLTFEPGEDRSITMQFRQKEADAPTEKSASSKGIKVVPKDDTKPDALVSAVQHEAEKNQKSEAKPEVIRTIALRHESLPPEKEAGFLNFIFGSKQEESSILTNPRFEMNVLQSADETGDKKSEEVVYQSADNRKTDMYEYINEPTGAFSHQIKNYTLYHYGEGKENELYTFDNAVLHLRADGFIEGYSVQLPDLSGQQGANEVSPSLLDRASRVLAQDQILQLHQNGGGQPDFILPAPFAVDKDGRLIEALTYQIAGNQFNQLKVMFNVTPESYPVVLDPTIQFTAPGASNVSDFITGEATTSFGFSVAAGDLNNDGKDDLAVGSFGSNGGNGAIYVFYQTDDYAASYTGADLSIAGEAGSALGSDLRIADMDGDGDKDLIATANAYDSGTGGNGRVYIFYNDGSYPANASGAEVKITGDPNTFLGDYLAIGDLDGDRINDLAVSAKLYNAEQGRAYIFYAAGGFPADVTGADHVLTGENGGDRFGQRIAIDDLDQDGDRDIVISSSGYELSQGRAYIFYNDGNYPATANLAEVIIDGAAGSSFGFSLTTGDLNQDGEADLVVGSHTYNGQQGRVHIFYNDGGYPLTAATADVNIDGEVDSGMGSKLVLGDFNDDGFNDLVAGGITYSGDFQGRVYTFYGGKAFPSSAQSADNIITGEAAFNGFGEFMTKGDLNADGHLDLVVGANQYNGGQGRVYLLYGEGSAVEQKETFTGQNNNDQFGYAFASADFDSDGTTDLAVGAPGFNAGDGIVYLFYNKGKSISSGVADFTILGSAIGGFFGSQLTAGDIDFDGDDDLLVSATVEDKVYYFSNANDGSYPANSAAANGSFSGTGDTQFGASLATGDIDFDGDEDVLIGAPADGNGVVRIYYNDGAAYGAADDTLSGTVLGGQFGDSLIVADLDADGDQDIGVGAPATANGNFYLFYNAGALYPDADGANVNLAGIGAGDAFGTSVVAKDLNSDQKADLLIGAPGNNGSALIYFNDGSYGPAADDLIDGPGLDSEFGTQVAIGDLNSDGTNDVVITSTGTTKGSAYVFYGPGPYPDVSGADLTILGDNAGDSFGSALALGDFDADGVNDVMISASAYSTSTGRVYPFFGKRDFSWVTRYPWRNNVGGSSGRYGNTHQIEGWVNNENFGHSIVSGDFDGDGNTDLAVGSPNYNGSEGMVYLFLNKGELPLNNNIVDVKITGFASGEFGFSLAAGELSTTRDTKTDLLIGAPGAATNDGTVYLFNGRSDWSGVNIYSQANHTFNGLLDANGRFGTALLVAPDLNTVPDGRPDFAVGAPNTANGNVYLYYGDGIYGASDVTLSGETAGDLFGSSLAAAELSAVPDARVDLLIGAPGYSTNTGRAYIFYNDGAYGAADVTFTGGAQGDEFGFSVAAGEVSAERDARDDVIIGSPGTANGTVYIHYNDGIYGVADITLNGEAAGNRFGQRVLAGDLNRDDQDDLAVASTGYSNSSGRVQVYYNNGGIQAASNDAITGQIGNNIYFGDALWIDDINGNGWNNLLIGGYATYSGAGSVYLYDYGAHYFSDGVGEQYGRGLAVGDFDGDGDKDLAIGNPANNANEGEVLIFLQDVTSMEKQPTLMADVTLVGAAGSEFGFALAAGEISQTADTKDDLLIGAPGVGTNDGAVYLFNGRSNWSGITAHNQADITFSGTDGADDRFGEALLAAGDLSATPDNRIDIAIAAPDTPNGSVYLFDNDGLYPTTAGTADITLSGSAAGGRFGVSMTAGHFNFDNRLDLALGAPLANTNDGEVYIFYNNGDYGAADIAISGEADSRLGTSLSSGDLDRDGDDDLIMGAPAWNINQGRVYVAYNDGGYPALAVDAELKMDGADSIYFGQAVKGADFNADGYIDLMAAAEQRNYVYFNDGSYPAACCNDYDLDYADSNTSYNFNSIARQIAVGDLTNDGKNDFAVASPGFSNGTGTLNFYQGEAIQCEPLNLNSLTITDTGGFTNDATPDLTLAYTGNGPAPVDAVFSCDDGKNWSAPVAVIGVVSPVVVDSFNMTNGATGCDGNEGLKNIWVRLRNECGYYSGLVSTDSTTYDISGPAVTAFGAAPDSATQITVTVNTVNDGTGSADPYQYQFSGEGCTGGLPERAWTIDTDADDIFTDLNPNTPYAFKVRGRDELENIGAYTACGPDVYTHASIPGAPIVSGATQTTLDVNPVSGGAEKELAIYIEEGIACDGEVGLGYVQADGTIGVGEVWQTDIVWDNQPVIGLQPGTQYAVCVKARNNDDLATAFGSATVATTLSPPSFSVGSPSDNASASATPTHVANNVIFSADVTDVQEDPFWLLVCKNNLAPVVGSPPECNGGANNRWAISPLTGNGVTAFANYQAQLGDPEVNVWYAFACDNSGCSAASQGAGDNGSPFNVNHPPVFGNLTVTDDTGGTVEPGDVIQFSISPENITETDVDGAQDTVSMYVCNSTTAGFDFGTNSCIDGNLICSALNVDPAAGAATCIDNGTQAPVPTAHGLKNYYVFMEDSHGLSSDSPNLYQYTVTDVPPVLINYNVTDTLNPVAGGSDAFTFNARLQDNNGEDDIVSVEGYLFNADAVVLADGVCNVNQQNCYQVPTCNLNLAYGDASQLEAQCTATFWFNANASANWEVHVNPADEGGVVTNLIDSNLNLNNPQLQGLGVTGGIAYGSVNIGQVSSEQIVTLQNLGNTVLDVGIAGTDLSDLGGNVIPRAQQEWSSVAGFNYETGNDLVQVADVQSAATGCYDASMPVRTQHNSGVGSDASTYWRYKVPTGISPGQYTGTNTFSAMTCEAGG